MNQRKTLFTAIIACSFLLITDFVVDKADTAGLPLQVEGWNVAVGNGFDLFADTIPRKLKDMGDVLYPVSMEGIWICDRAIKSIDGDTYQAKELYRALGCNNVEEYFKINQVESFPTKFMKSGDGNYVINDRGYELLSRTKNINTDSVNVNWNIDEPNILEYINKNKKKIQLIVKDRSNEIPNDKGFGFNELLCIQDESSFITRAVQMKRRYRRSYDAQGNRIVEGIEIIKTFRVLDGIAGTEYPTSTIKSAITLYRPPA